MFEYIEQDFQILGQRRNEEENEKIDQTIVSGNKLPSVAPNHAILGMEIILPWEKTFKYQYQKVTLDLAHSMWTCLCCFPTSWRVGSVIVGWIVRFRVSNVLCQMF